MENNKTNILLVENQEKQFRKIHTCFSNLNSSSLYEIFPDIGNFVSFIDCVRVWVNKNYDKTYRESAMNTILATIEEHNIGIILMDYKLGAGYLSETGIDLATAINNVQNSTLPVVFISKDQKNEKIETELEKYNWAYEWAYKGFFGDEILQPEYIKKYVIKEGIEKLLNTEFSEKANQ